MLLSGLSGFPRLKVRLSALSFGLLCWMFFPGWGYSSGKRPMDRQSVLGELATVKKTMHVHNHVSQAADTAEKLTMTVDCHLTPAG